MHRAVLASLLAVAAQLQPAAAPEAFHFGRYGSVALYQPTGPVRNVIIFMSGAHSWDSKTASMVRELGSDGTAIASISTPAYLRAWEKDRIRCINPNLDMVALAQEAEHRLGLKSYVEPVIVGESAGAALAYATVAQAPDGLYRGAVSLDFTPRLAEQKPWCRENGFAAMRSGRGWTFAPIRHVGSPWIALTSATRQEAARSDVRDFVAHIDGAKLVVLPPERREPTPTAQVEAAIRPLLARPAAPRPAPAALPDDLPLTQVASPGPRNSDLMAVFYSGDGGWAGLDRSVSAQLAAAGVPVVGVDSLKYFWTARTPAKSANDLARIINGYGAAWHRSRVLLIGYSFGAGALPATVAALPPALRERIAQLTLMGVPLRGELEFHLSDWLDASSAPAAPTAPLIAKLGTSLRVQCLRGMEESDSACPAIPAARAEQVVLPGGHHFAGNDGAVAAAILRGVRLA